MEAFIPAAGLGTRLRPLTDKIPKALVELNGTPILELQIKKLISYSIEKIIINVHHFGSQIEKFLEKNKNFGIEIIISDEKRLLLDTGGGLKKASRYITGSSFLIHNSDIFTNLDIKKFLDFHTSNNCIATLAVQQRNSSRYLLFDRNKILCGWENVKTGEKIITRPHQGDLSRMAFSGIHAGTRDLFNLFPDKEVFSVIDFYLSIAAEHQITYFNHTDSVLIDLGKIENLSKAEEILRKETDGL